MKLIACCHPGKIGDTLFTLPAVRELCKIHDAKAVLFGQSWIEPARDLIEYQSFIHELRTDAPETIVPGRLQPITNVPEKEKYSAVFDISWSRMDYFPLPESLAECAGLPRAIGRDLQLDVTNDNPWIKFSLPFQYIVITTRSQGEMIFTDLFKEFIKKSPIPVIVMGAKSESLGCGVDMTGLGFLDMALIISYAKAYVGVFSSPLVVAQAFPIPKTCIFDGVTWHPTQIIKDGETEYLVNPTVEQLIESSGRELRVKRI